MGMYPFLACPLGISTASGEYQARMTHELQDYYINGAIVYIDETVMHASTVKDSYWSWIKSYLKKNVTK